MKICNVVNLHIPISVLECEMTDELKMNFMLWGDIQL